MISPAPSNLEHAEVLDQIKILKEVAAATRRAGTRCHRQDSRDALAMLATELDQTVLTLQQRATDLESVYASMPITSPKPTKPPVPPSRPPTRPASFPTKPLTPKELKDDDLP